MGINNEKVPLPPIKNRDLIKIEFMSRDIRVSEIRTIYLDHKPTFCALFDTHYLYHVEENRLYYLHRADRQMFTTWRDYWTLVDELPESKVLGLYRLGSDGYLPYYWWENK